MTNQKQNDEDYFWFTLSLPKLEAWLDGSVRTSPFLITLKIVGAKAVSVVISVVSSVVSSVGASSSLNTLATNSG